MSLLTLPAIDRAARQRYRAQEAQRASTGRAGRERRKKRWIETKGELLTVQLQAVRLCGIYGPMVHRWRWNSLWLCRRVTMVIAELYMSQSELDRRCTCGRRTTHSQRANVQCASTVFARLSRICLSLCHFDGISHLHERPRADHINEVCNNKNCRENCFVDGKMTDRICSGGRFFCPFLHF